MVINTFNRADSLRLTLESLSLQSVELLEVVVVNGPSTDSTAAVLDEFAGQIVLGGCPERNLSMSRNIGIRLAAGDIVAFIDDDAYPDPGWLAALAAAFDDPEVGATGGPTYDHTGVSFQAVYNLADWHGDPWWDDRRNPTPFFNHPDGATIPYVHGTNAAFRRSALVDVGGWDEEYEYYLDETDVCRRLSARAWVVAPLDHGYVYHKYLASHMRDDSRVVRNRYSLLKNRLYFALRHAAQLNEVPHDEVMDRWHRFVSDNRREMLAHLREGRLELGEFQTFEADVVRARVMGFAAAAGPRKTRPCEWFGRPQMFKPFPRRPHAMTSRHVAHVIDGDAEFAFAAAQSLGARGDHVHVVVPGLLATVDLEQFVWVHRVPCPESYGPNSVANALVAEVRRIEAARPLDDIEINVADLSVASFLGRELSRR